jgi:methylmalonyl-CoA mutase cobalamin-binding subunit
MAELLNRAQLLPEPELPDLAELISEGQRLARGATIGRSAFQDHYDVSSEAEYKRLRAEEGQVMLHAQIGFRDSSKTARSCAEIYETLEKRGYHIDRFGMCFDRNMGYPSDIRGDMPKGTGLILETPEDWETLTRAAPVAPHFGDFMIGMPAAVENAMMALAAGSTSMGNLSHFYSYRMLYMDDEVERAAAAVKAMALVAAAPVEVMISCNNDDGFGPLFSDLACCAGLVMIEKHIIEGLLGGCHATVFGNMFANPFNRMVFQRALLQITDNPGPMVYGATTTYGADHDANRAALAHYLTFDIAAQQLGPTGHAVVPVPITEYERIPDTQEIIEVQIFGNRLIEQSDKVLPLINIEKLDEAADELVAGGQHFKDNLFRRFTEIGIDTDNPLELLLAIRRSGARRLERWFGPGEEDENAIGGRRPLLIAENMSELQADSQAFLDALEPEAGSAIRDHGFVACVATSDVHEYGKIMVEQILGGLDVDVVDGGVSVDPKSLAEAARDGEADFIALSTYNGIALSYLTALRAEMTGIALDIPVFVGGRLNQIPEGSNTSLPVDVSGKLADSGAEVCHDVHDMLDRLVAMPSARDRAA